MIRSIYLTCKFILKYLFLLFFGIINISCIFTPSNKTIMNNQNNLEYIKDQMQRGIMTADQANIEKVRMDRFVIIKNKIPQSVRKALMSGVKSGLLKRKMKSSENPEYFYHPNFEHLAKQEIYSQKCKVIQALKSICK